ncbi:MAG: DNA primase [Acidobacteria bacterium]|nr:DNA primase [Acidobacteriota bacterium]
MPFFEDHVLDEVRNSVNIVSLVSEYVSLRKRGRNHLARCPFHNEKTPSFNVNEEKQIFMCFGCGLGGDVFKFIMQIEHLSFPESVRFLAERSGIRLPEASSTHPGAVVSNSDTLRRAMAEAVATYHHCLRHTDEGKSALRYLADRGITEETIGRFSLGYSPSGGNYLVPLLQKKGFPLQALEDCGLAKRSEDGNRIYDSFRGRVMFPITDVQGRPVAFGARATDGRPPKYLNSPETRLYNKSRNLFGLSFAKDAIRERGYAILVEGYMDFVIPFQQGVHNLVASLGTSLTPQQVELLGRYTHEAVVSYDPDSAGLAAAQRSLDLFLEGDFRVKVLRLPEGQDPDAFVRASGADAYRERAEAAVPYLEFVLEAAIGNQGALDDPKNKIQVMNTVLPYLARLPSAVERSEYVFRFARRLGIEDRQLLAETKRAAQQKRGRLGEETMARAVSMRTAEKKLLQLLVGHGELQEHILPLCCRQDFEGLAGEKIFAALLEEFDRGGRSGFTDLHRRFAGEPEQDLLAHLEMEEMPESPSPGTAESSLNALRTMRLTAYKQQIVLKIAEAAERNDEETLTHLLEQRVAVDRELVGLSSK